jgi:hypothetical protein
MWTPNGRNSRVGRLAERPLSFTANATRRTSRGKRQAEPSKARCSAGSDPNGRAESDERVQSDETPSPATGVLFYAIRPSNSCWASMRWIT